MFYIEYGNIPTLTLKVYNMIVLRRKSDGAYVGPKGHWSGPNHTKHVADLQKARVFRHIGGARGWFGKPYDKPYGESNRRTLQLEEFYDVIPVQIKPI